MGNHLAFVTDGAAIPVPSYTRALDYELELGCVLAHGLLDATPQEAEAAIGGFVVFNDFSARDVQHAEMLSGFGPQKAKHFRNAISSVVVTADEVLPHWRALKGSVRINGKLDLRSRPPPTRAGRWARPSPTPSRSERLYPGEFFGSGTLPGGSGIETGRLLAAGDVIEIGIDRIGTLTNRIVAREDAAMKVIDLSKPIQFNRGDPFFMQVKIRHKRHAAARLLVRLLGLPFRLMPKDFVGWADDTITRMGVHSTTHIDAPWHYGPTSRRRAGPDHRPDPARALHRPRRRPRHDAQGRQRPHHDSRHGGGAGQDRRKPGREHDRPDPHGPRQAARHQGLLEDRHRHVASPPPNGCSTAASP